MYFETWTQVSNVIANLLQMQNTEEQYSEIFPHEARNKLKNFVEKLQVILLEEEEIPEQYVMLLLYLEHVKKEVENMEVIRGILSQNKFPEAIEDVIGGFTSHPSCVRVEKARRKKAAVKRVSRKRPRKKPESKKKRLRGRYR